MDNSIFIGPFSMKKGDLDLLNSERQINRKGGNARERAKNSLATNINDRIAVHGELESSITLRNG